MRTEILTMAGILASVMLLLSVPAFVTAQDAGQERYVTSGCAACHGEAGQGSALGPRLADNGQSVEAFVNYVRSPAWTMIAYP